MKLTQKLTDLLTGKTFEHDGKKYSFVSCKAVASNIMIITNQKTLQIPIDHFDNFYKKVASNCKDFYIGNNEVAVAPKHIVYKTAVMPEVPKTYEKLNLSFEALIDEINSATDNNVAFIEAKAKMLTSVAQTAINMENSRINLIKILNNN
jgi:hypothetical protein